MIYQSSICIGYNSRGDIFQAIGPITDWKPIEIQPKSRLFEVEVVTHVKGICLVSRCFYPNNSIDIPLCSNELHTCKTNEECIDQSTSKYVCSCKQG